MRLLPLLLALGAWGCTPAPPAAWSGPGLTAPRKALTAAELQQAESSALLDMSFFRRPDWAEQARHGFAGAIRFSATQMDFPLARPPHPGEDRFPAFSADFVSHQGTLIPLQTGVIDTRADNPEGWDVILGAGQVWSESEEPDWSRAAFPLQLTDRYVGAVRNCVASFVYAEATMSRVQLQCSQETADLDDAQIGDIRARIAAQYQPARPEEALQAIAAHSARQRARLPTAPLAAIDRRGELAAYFNRPRVTAAPTSLGALYLDGRAYLHPPQTRHGPYPYPEALRHGVYSVSKSLVGALALFHFAQRYGDALFDTPIAQHVPALAERPEWQGVTFAHALNMATGTAGGEAAEWLFQPLMMAASKEVAIANIARFGDGPGEPGERFHYATTHFFVLSYALQNLVETREGTGVRYWDLLREDVLRPIGAAQLDVLHTRDAQPGQRLPLLGYGARPNLDEALRIARLIAAEGEHQGRQLLSRQKVREALGRTPWPGYPTGDPALHYRHAFWSGELGTGACRVAVSYMQGHGSNHVLILPGDALVMRFMDEADDDLDTLVDAVQRLRGACVD